MHRAVAYLAVALSLCVACFAQSPAPTLVASVGVVTPSAPTLTIRKDVREVRVTFHALDRHKHSVLDLPPDSLTIFDNGQPVNAISTFNLATDLPLSIALMVDASDSIARDFAAEQHTSAAFVTGLVRSTDDRLTLIAFRNHVDVSRKVTGNADEFASTLRQIKVGGLTALYDAIIATSEGLAASDPSASRRAIILISDGDDTDSRFSLNDAINAAVRDDVAVYSVSIRSRNVTVTGEKVLKLIADATGGRTYSVRATEDLSRAMQEIERDLRTQYLLTYKASSTASGFHTLKLTSSAKDVSIRVRSGYFAVSH